MLPFRARAASRVSLPLRPVGKSVSGRKIACGSPAKNSWLAGSLKNASRPCSSSHAPLWNQVLVTIGGRSKSLDEGFRIALLDKGEAAELALDPVVIAVAITVGADERRVGDEILGLEPLDNLNGEGQLGDPRAAREPVLQIELGRGRVLDLGVAPMLFWSRSADAVSARPSDRHSACCGGHRRAATTTRPGRPCRCPTNRSL